MEKNLTHPQERRPGNIQRWWLVAAVAAGVAFSIALVVHAHRANGIHGFPLDDPWIHLTYARNLALHHSFTYFPGDPSTGGSTSPLYTLLLALGFHITHNEKLLSYVLGIVFHAGFLSMAVWWGWRRLGSVVWAAAFVLVLALDSRVAILSVSGMETSLFLFLTASAFWAWSESRLALLGVALGLGVWTRPDMLILGGVFALAALATRLHPPQPRDGVERPRVSPVRAMVRFGIPFGALLLAYFTFNRVVGGSFFPNTLLAKHTFYRDPIPYFFTHGFGDAVFTGVFQMLTPLAAAAILVELVRWARRRPASRLAEAGWVMGLLLAYVVYVPFAHRFSRYLVPALPAMVLLGLALCRDVLQPRAWHTPRGAVSAVVLIAVVGVQVWRVPAAAEEYRHFCAYHYVRHERCGRWLHDHTPPTAVVATHDVGAIAYYSGRRVIDMVGLIQSEAVAHLNQPGYTNFLNDFFSRENVTHVASLENWMRYAKMEIANEQTVWIADPEPEILKVSEWAPGWTVLVPHGVSELNRRAGALMREGKSNEATGLLARSLEAAPHNPATWYLTGATKSASGDHGLAEKAYRRAIELYPEFEHARYSLGLQLAKEGRSEEALAVLGPLHQRNPDFAGLRPLWESLQSR